MCGTILHGVFNLVLLASTGLLIASLFTPAWRHFEQKADTQGKDEVDRILSTGLVMKDCVRQIDTCAKTVWEDLPRNQKIAAILLAGAILLCIIAIIWSCVMFCACCCQGCLVTPLPILCGLAAILTGAAVATYVLAEDESTKPFSHLWWQKLISEVKGNVQEFDDIQRRYGYSVFLAICGGIGLLADVVVSVCLLCTAKSSIV